MEIISINMMDGRILWKISVYPPHGYMQQQPTIMGIYPWSKGFGYAVFEGTDNLSDYGHPLIPSKNTGRYTRRIRTLIREWNPDAIILRVEKRGMASRSENLRSILVETRKLAQDFDIPITEYSGDDIRETFGLFSAYTKQDIAEKICQWFPILEEYCPPKRRLGYNQNYWMSIFDAISLVCAHYHFSS